MKAINYLLSTESSENPLGIINCDWLAFSVRLMETSKERDNHAFTFRQPKGYRLIEYTGTNIYRRRLILYHSSGRKVLTLLCEPHSRVIDRLAMLVEVANEYLYTGYAFMLGLVNEIHPCLFLCLSRFDLCCDFVATSDRLRLIRQLSTNEAYVQGKKDGSSFHNYTSEDTGIERTNRQQSWGSKHSNIKWKVYNKSLEIFEIDKQGHRTCDKPYIAAEWQRAGWDVLKVWRIEVSISPAAKFQFYGKRLNWNLAINGFEITDLFVSLYMTRFVVRLNQGHRDKSNDKRVHLLADLGEVQRVTQYINPTPKDLPVVEYAASLNAAMLQLSKPEVIINEDMRQLWIDTTVKCVKIGHLEQYFYDKYKYSVTEISTKCMESLQV